MVWQYKAGTEGEMYTNGHATIQTDRIGSLRVAVGDSVVQTYSDEYMCQSMGSIVAIQDFDSKTGKELVLQTLEDFVRQPNIQGPTNAALRSAQSLANSVSYYLTH